MIHRDPSYLDPPDQLDEDEAERREDALLDEGDRRYDERRDRELERLGIDSRPHAGTAAERGARSDASA